MKFIICDSQRIKNCIDFISNLPTDKNFHVTISDKKPRSLNQNDLWHKWIDLMAKEGGSSPSQKKDEVKREILGMREHINKRTGELTYFDYHSSELTKEQFSRLMTQTQVLALEYYGLALPNKDDL